MTAAPAPGGGRASVHELRVTLLDVSPPVWRRVRVPSELSLGGLHHVLQLALGWEDAHLHQWEIGEASYGSAAEEDWGDPLEDESSVDLATVAPLDSAFHYHYDLGDGWDHLVEVERIEPYDARVPPVECLAGERACPPEDCGGPAGYEHLLDALGDPDDPEHDDVAAWVGDAFDPERFDRAATNRRLAALWRPA